MGGFLHERRAVAALRALEEPDGAFPVVFASDREHRIPMADGGHLRVVERGQGQPVLLIHGYSSTLDIWAGVARELQGQPVRLLAIDLRGHGGSSKILENATLEDLASDVASVMRSLDLTDAICVGHSVGSIICQILGAETPVEPPLQIESLLLVSTTGRGAHGDWRARLIGVVVPLRIVTAMLSRPRIGPLLLRRSFGSPVPFSRVLAVQATASKDVHARKALVPRRAMLDTSALLQRIEITTRILVGSKDPITPPAEARRVLQGIGGSTLRIIEGAGHLLPVECPEIIAEEVLRISGVKHRA
jgi:pimeloyl-ACP methyl ester carboxylesterase